MKRSLFYFLPALICAACMLEGCRKNELQEEHGPQSSEISVGQPEAYPGEGGVFSLLYSIKNPREGVELELTSSKGWISELGADKRMITFTLSENTTITTRKGNIKLSYDGAESVTVEIAYPGRN